MTALFNTAKKFVDRELRKNHITIQEYQSSMRLVEERDAEWYSVVEELKNTILLLKCHADTQFEVTNWEPSKAVHTAESFLCMDILKYVDTIFGEVKKT